MIGFNSIRLSHCLFITGHSVQMSINPSAYEFPGTGEFRLLSEWLEMWPSPEVQYIDNKSQVISSAKKLKTKKGGSQTNNKAYGFKRIQLVKLPGLRRAPRPRPGPWPEPGPGVAGPRPGPGPCPGPRPKLCPGHCPKRDVFGVRGRGAGHGVGAQRFVLVCGAWGGGAWGGVASCQLSRRTHPHVPFGSIRGFGCWQAKGQ